MQQHNSGDRQQLAQRIFSASKFTERAKRAITSAGQEAARYGGDAIGQEHLLLGLIRESDGLAAKLLVGWGLDENMLRDHIGPRDAALANHPQSELDPDAITIRTLELAAEEARRLNHGYIGTEHLLLGIAGEGTGKGTAILSGIGITSDAVRIEVLRALAGTSSLPLLKQMFNRFVDGEKGTRRYSLVLPESLFQQVQQLADEEQTTVVELIRRFVKLGLLASEIQKKPDAALLIREGEREREIVFL